MNEREIPRREETKETRETVIKMTCGANRTKRKKKKNERLKKKKRIERKKRK